jgi:hypothetical protein
VVALGFGDAILPNLIEQSFVADLQHCGGLLAIPVGLLESLPDGLAFGFVFGAASQRLQPAGVSTLGRGTEMSAARAVVAWLQLGDGEIGVA